MDLSALNSSLPAGLADAERDMGEKFRAAALSITTLYKSSLACNKQAYQVGYSAALSDVLSKLQSDIAAGEDAAVALARLMDWTEARQTAMVAFAADDDEVPPTATRQHAPPAQQHRNLAPPRPASAPIPDSRARGFGKDKERESGLGPSSLRHDAMDADDVHHPSSRRLAVPVTAALERSPSDDRPLAPPSSSPIASPCISRPLAPPPLRLQRTTSSRASSSSSNTQIPTSTFNFSIPTTLDIVGAGVPTSGPAQTGPIGSKRPIVDAEMADSNTPTTPSRGPRAAKRRQMGLALGETEEKERGNGERRRPGRRGGGLGA